MKRGRTLYVTALVAAIPAVWAIGMLASGSESSPDLPNPAGKPAADDPAGALVASWLEEAFDGQPMTEAAEMLVAIARGGRMGPGAGWFHPGQSRYDWNWLAGQHGVPASGSISRSAFRGSAAQFDRLDSNHDGVLRADDFDAAAPAAPGRTAAKPQDWFQRIDSSGDGRVTRDEWNKFFDEAARGKDHLTPADLRQALAGGPAARPAASGMPSTQVLVRGLFRGEVGSMHEGPKLNESAPDFTLRTRDGNGSVHLRDQIGKRPIVLTFGNFTCRPFRATYPRVDELVHRYKDEALFFGVYVREAHPTDGWRMESNDAAGVAIAQPRNYAERVSVANTCSAKLNMSMPLLVDEIDDRTGHAYSGMPGRLYLIDTDGKVAYKSGRGPFGFKPDELERALVMLQLDLQEKQKASQSGATK